MPSNEPKKNEYRVHLFSPEFLEPVKTKVYQKLGYALDFARMQFLYGDYDIVEIANEYNHPIVTFYCERK